MAVRVWDEATVARLAARFEGEDPRELLAWAVEEFHPAIALGTGFNVEGIVILDMLWRGPRMPRVFLLDTGRLPQETYDLVERVRARYGVTVELHGPDPARLEPMLREHGPNLFYRSVEHRKLCCHVRKVEPLRRALAGLEAWIAGLRREQGPTRTRIAKIELDAATGGLLKINPLADWTWEDAWAYVRANDVPYHALHDRGYPSIGCAPCTRPVRAGEDPRAGRWWWERPEEKECGLHRLTGPNGEELR